MHWLWSRMWNGCCLVKHSKTLLVSTTTADAVFDWCTHWWCFTWCATNNKNAVMWTSWPCCFDQWRVHVASFDFVTNFLPVWRTEESMNPTAVGQTGWQMDRQTDRAAAGYEIRNAATIKVVLDEKLRAVLYFYMDRVQCCWKRRKNIQKKTWSYSHTLISGSVRSKWTLFSCPVCIVMVSLCPRVSSCLSLSLFSSTPLTLLP